MQLRDTRKKQAAANVQAATEFYGGAPLDPKQLMGDNDVEAEAQEQEYSGDEIVSHVIIEEFRPSDDDEEDLVNNRKFGNKSSSLRHQQQQDDEYDEHDDEMMGENDEEEYDGFGKADDGWNNWQERSKPSGSGMVDEDRNTNIFGILPSSKPRKAPIRPQDEFDSLVKVPEKKPSKKFTYETKAARRATTDKQKARRSEKSQLGRNNKTSKSSRKGSAK